MKKLFAIFFMITIIFNISFADIASDSGNILVKLGVMTGYPDGTLGLERDITRAEFSVMVIKLQGLENEKITDTTKFSDVKTSHWAYNVIMKAREKGYLTGYQDGTFRPSNKITYAETCAIIVNMLGYNSTLEGAWPDNVINKAVELGITENISATAKKELTRGEVATMLVNAMDVTIK